MTPNGRRPHVSAIILAAGSSTRMGRAKAFLDYRGETFLGRLIRLFRVYCENVLVVSSSAFEIPQATVVVNPAPERGMLSSLQCALNVLPDDSRAVAFTPVDIPSVQESTVHSVIGGWTGELLRIPRYGEKRGHPVLIARTLIPEFLAQPPTAQAREVVRRHESDINYVDVNDPGILIDVDTPADYEQLQ